MAKSKLLISNHKLRKIISFVLSFLLSLSLLGVTALGCVKNGLFSTKTILRLMDEEYCTAVRKETEDALSDYTIPTGIDTSVVEGVVTVSDVTTDVKGYIYAAFAGNDYSPNTTLMDERIKANVVKFFEENSAELDQDTDEIIDKFIAELDAVYTASIELRIINAVVKANKVFSRFYMPSLIALLVLSLILGTLCVKIHHYPHRGLRYVAYAVGGTSLMSLIFPTILLASGKYKNLMFEPEHFYKLAINYIRGFLMQFIWAAAIWLFVMVLLNIIVSLLRKEKIKSEN